MAELMEPELTIFAGATGAGKSTWIMNFIKTYKRNVIVAKHTVNINDKAFLELPEKTMSNWRQGVAPGGMVKCKIAIASKKEWLAFLKWCKTNFRHGLVVADDAIMFERDRPSDPFLEFLVMKRHYAMNIFLPYHGLSAIPIEMFTYANKLILFETTDNPDYKASKIPQADLLNKAIRLAKRNVLNPATKYTPIIVKLRA